MDKHTIIKMKVLEILNEYRKTEGPFARKDLKEISDILSIDFDYFMKVYANELYNDNQINMDSGWCAFITPKGIAIVDVNNPFYQEYKKIEMKNINILGSVSDSTIIQGNNNKVDITINFYEDLKREINKSEMKPDEKRSWLKRINDFSKNPIVSQIVLNLISEYVKAQTI
ncbi:MAG: hypothetical protein ABIJ40_16385 [Bacteroidota bacterium]|nr:hypothetical protein [Candidatus Margulisiibacteriota bacterium]